MAGGCWCAGVGRIYFELPVPGWSVGGWDRLLLAVRTSCGGTVAVVISVL